MKLIFRHSLLGILILSLSQPANKFAFIFIIFCIRKWRGVRNVVEIASVSFVTFIIQLSVIHCYYFYLVSFLVEFDKFFFLVGTLGT